MTPIDLGPLVCDLFGREVAMVKGRKVRPSEAGELLAEWEGSGEPMSSWCEKRGVNWYSLSAYKGWGVRAEVAFAEVVEEEAPLQAVAVGAARYRVEVGAVTIEVSDDFRCDTLQRLVRAVAAC